MHRYRLSLLLTVVGNWHSIARRITLRTNTPVDCFYLLIVFFELKVEKNLTVPAVSLSRLEAKSSGNLPAVQGNSTTAAKCAHLTWGGFQKQHPSDRVVLFRRKQNAAWIIPSAGKLALQPSGKSTVEKPGTAYRISATDMRHGYPRPPVYPHFRSSGCTSKQALKKTNLLSDNLPKEFGGGGAARLSLA